MTQPEKAALRAIVRTQLPKIVDTVNGALAGHGLERLEPILQRVGRGSTLPHWYAQLRDEGTLPNLDGKTIGSIVEMILVAVLETTTFADLGIPALRINPAKGVDLPDLDLGVKSPSANFCTSEPFFSSYERLYGSEHDALVLLTDYQKSKKKPPLRLQVSAARYLSATEIADATLCRIARGHRAELLDESEARAKKFFRFLAFVNQGDWHARILLQLVEALRDERAVRVAIAEAETDFKRQNRARARSQRLLLSDQDVNRLRQILDISPIHVGVLEAADNWVVETWKELGRTRTTTNGHDWSRDH